ncbi:MAG: 2Fe-2S iron-sulfur cluster binding domain-containing protein [bacterium]|nr:2Fe-2S iron-sulfur cluster binding domain-containing protein [bacterium]
MMELRLLLNDRPVVLRAAAGRSTLSWLRETRELTGTKEGCAEGECGACAVLLGEPTADGIAYCAVPACLLPLGELAGRHLVTIEGLNHPDGLGPVQQALVDQGAPQCGFCFPGIVVALTGYFLTCGRPDPVAAVAALDGNICRCTGYASTVRAVENICRELAPHLNATSTRVADLVTARVLPGHLNAAPRALSALAADAGSAPAATLVGGGTDLLVQRPDELAAAEVVFASCRPDLRTITRDLTDLIIGGAVTVSELGRHPDVAACLPDAPEMAARFGSTLVRNRATVAGNLVNASPIADLAILLLAHDAELVLERDGGARRLPLRAFYRGYKDIDLAPGEIVAAVRVRPPAAGTVTNFEKISKRRNLDIASVNGAAVLRVDNDAFAAADLTVGGVAPVPFVAVKTAAFLVGKPVTAKTLHAAADVLDQEIAPIDDVRGSARYKRLAARRILFAHALKTAPNLLSVEAFV